MLARKEQAGRKNRNSKDGNCTKHDFSKERQGIRLQDSFYLFHQPIVDFTKEEAIEHEGQNQNQFRHLPLAVTQFGDKGRLLGHPHQQDKNNQAVDNEKQALLLIRSLLAGWIGQQVLTGMEKPDKLILEGQVLQLLSFSF